ncbi:DUF4198 domain-containing protein [Segetibacter sp. 3557_3]|uniref:DUF4198 domain-containing protein n=1 Tax=Segetibacter sp. 3557_3 TaxID=2547429 RepID=UPI001058A81D|nr:DUF4198 domain-containing protein [Segetibacter sp. 3557_3]TDH23534.1 DUF4198 domain-containing protein [Segetibacter sp. 3557_3]
MVATIVATVKNLVDKTRQIFQRKAAPAGVALKHKTKMKKALTIICMLFIGSILNAHEYVLLAYKYHVQKGDTLEVHLFVADGFNIQLERPVQKKLTRNFGIITANGTTDLLSNAREGALPVLETKVDFDGLGLIHLERDYSRIALTTAKFREYLKEDHIENIDVSKDPADKLQPERYSRYIKSLVLSGDKPQGDLYKKVLGQNFEIVLLDNPYLLRKGSLLRAQVLFMGKPIANKMITARNRTGNESALHLKARTDATGICSFKLPRAGEWFIHATHMIPCVDKTDSDWDSFWTSYSFQLP